MAVVKKITNKQRILQQLKKQSEKYTIGCYSEDMEKVPQKELQKIIDVLGQEYTDIYIHIRGKLYIVELATVDNEKDFVLLEGTQYFSRYGEDTLENALENEEVTREEYNRIMDHIG
jgi:hypothetical protein